MDILVLNCGSSSLKFAVIDTGEGEVLLSGLAERLAGPEALVSWRRGDAEKERRAIAGGDHAAAMKVVVEVLREHGLQDELRGVGHRVVHGGERFKASVVIDESVVAEIEKCVPLAPLHNPANLVGIRAGRAMLGELTEVAVFDTAFHQAMPKHAYLYPVPYELYSEHGVRRYGFHGTSHRFVARRAAKILGKPLEETALITAHLGNGCSAAAVLGGRSIDTTMGLTPLEGLVMGTRSGDVDPALHGFLKDQLGWDVERTTKVLNKESGLLGISGKSNDMRTLEEAAAAGDERAVLAIEVFCYRLAKAIGALAVPLGRIDALVFTGGIGENSAPIRAKVLGHLGVLGFALDPERNDGLARGSQGPVTQDGSSTALVVPTNEEWMIALDTAELVEATS